MTPSPMLYCAECGRPSATDELARFGEMLVCPNCKDRYAQKLREGVAPARFVVYGGFWIRFVASLIDGIILLMVGSVVQLSLGGSAMVPMMQPGTMPSVEMLGRIFATTGLVSLINMLIGAVYEGLFLGKLGATPGKMALGLKVVRPDGSPISVARGFGRHFAKFLSMIILMIGYIMAGFDSEKRALHDIICDTRVVKAS